MMQRQTKPENQPKGQNAANGCFVRAKDAIEAYQRSQKETQMIRLGKLVSEGDFKGAGEYIRDSGMGKHEVLSAIKGVLKHKTVSGWKHSVAHGSEKEANAIAEHFSTILSEDKED